MLRLNTVLFGDGPQLIHGRGPVTLFIHQTLGACSARSDKLEFNSEIVSIGECLQPLAPRIFVGTRSTDYGK